MSYLTYLCEEVRRVNSSSIFFIAIFVFSSLLFPWETLATTYYVRADGTVTAANKANATNPASADTSLNMVQVNAATFSAGDQILFSSQGGSYVDNLIIPSGGSGVGSEIVYANVSLETPIISTSTYYLITTNSKSHIRITGFSLDYTGTTTSANIFTISGNNSSNITLSNNTVDGNGYGYGIISGATGLSSITLSGNNVASIGSTKNTLYFYGTGLTGLTITNQTSAESNSSAKLRYVNGLTINGYTTSGTANGAEAGIYIDTCSGVVNISNATSTISSGIVMYFTGCTFGAGSTISNVSMTGAGGTGIFIYNSTGNGLTVSNSSYTGNGSYYGFFIQSTTGINFTSDTTVAGGFYLTDSTSTDYTDCTATGGYGFIATTTNSGASSDISYLRCSAGSQASPGTWTGFLATGRVNNVTYTNCSADYNKNLGFAAIALSSNITYRNCSASYNGLINVTSDGGGFLPHNSATNVNAYYCLAHHNYNEGFGDVSNGTNSVYNSVSWSNGYAIGDLFRGVAVATASTRGDLYYSALTGAVVTNKNMISGGNSKPRQILNLSPTLTSFDYNLYHALDDSKFVSNDQVTNASWTTYHASNETNSQNGDPLFTNENSNDFTLTATSPAIDAGTGVGLTTDYLGNNIYGVPDIGAYEYQPPFTFALNDIPTTGSVRLYSDGKYRMTMASSSAVTANFSVAPVGGNYSTTTQYMDITINTWSTTGDKNKKWTATSTAGDFLTQATSTVYTIGDLTPSVYYNFHLDGSASTTAVTDNSQCTAGVCLADGSGNLTFTYVGGYSTHVFELIKDVSSPSIAVTGPAEGVTVSGSNIVLSASASDDISVASIQFTIDGVNYGNPITTSPYSLAWSSLLVGDGSHTITATALDTSGNYATSSEINFFVANQPAPHSYSSAGGGGSTSIIVVNNATTTAVSPRKVFIPTITRDLFFGVSNYQVRELQKFLNNQGFVLAKSGAGSKGHETTYFGLATKNAVIKLQKANQIKPSVGYVGPVTRQAILKLAK